MAAPDRATAPSGTAQEAAPLPLVVRSCATNEDLESWASFCALRGFAHRAGAADRFYTKYVADPTARIDWTFIGVTASNLLSAPLPSARLAGDEGVVVGSVRLFDRTIDVDGAPAGCIGWGEVCSDPELRGRGVAGAVLSRAVSTMDSAGPPFTVSLLHAAVAVMPLYAKLGFRPLLTEYGTLALGGGAGRAILSSSSSSSIVSVRQPVLSGGSPTTGDDGNDDLEGLRACHAHTMRSLGVTGWPHRDGQYWRRWIPHAARGQLWVAERPAAGAGGAASACSSAEGQGTGSGSGGERKKAAGGGIIAYAAAHWRDDKLKLVDVGVHESATQEELHSLLGEAYRLGWGPERKVARAAAAAHAAASSSSTSTATASGGAGAGAAAEEDEGVAALVPVRILRWMQEKRGEGSGATETELGAISLTVAEQDPGWMVRPLKAAGEEGEAAARSLEKAAQDGRFLILGLDGF
jgi:hypothetical protein